MGILGSKEELKKVVSIYGFNSNEFSWLNTDDRNVYHTNGLIIENSNGKKYIITTRSKIISCKNIIMYYSYFDDKNTILRNNLHVLFQFIEYNIIILGTVDSSELDLSLSEVVMGDFDKNQIISGYKYQQLSQQSSTKIPTKRSKYYTVIINLDLNSKELGYDVNVFDVKFVKNMVYEDTYLPSNYLYKFKIADANNANLCGICGAIIFNKKHKLIGMVSISKGNELYVLPCKAFERIIYDFYAFESDPSSYHGLLTLPFIDKIEIKKVDSDSTLPDSTLSLKAQVESTLPDSTHKIIINTQSTIKTLNGNKKIKCNDEIIMINNKELVIDEDNVLILDTEYNYKLSLDLYLRLNMKNAASMSLTIKRKNKLINMQVLGESINKYIFPITNQPYFSPINTIPYINLKGIIIVELTHELLDICFAHNIILSNDLIDELLEHNDGSYQRNLIIIDCLTNKYIKLHNMPSLSSSLFQNQKKYKHQVFIVNSVNGTSVSNLNELNAFQTESVITMNIGYSSKDMHFITF